MDLTVDLFCDTIVLEVLGPLEVSLVVRRDADLSWSVHSDLAVRVAGADLA